jgi:ParB/RepB/Spo0J family partition protein
VSAVHPSGLNPRENFDEDGLEELAESIVAHGVLQPIVVRKDDVGYSIIIGERRWRAAKRAGLVDIPACVRSGVTDVQALQLAIIENLQREDLNPIEEAEGYRTLRKIGGMSQDAIALAVNRSQGAISKMLQLAELPESVRRLIRSGELSPRQGWALIKYAEYPAALCAIAEIAVEHNLTVSNVEAELGTWGPAGIIGVRLIQQDLAVQIGYQADPCHGKVCPFHARFGTLCLDPVAHAERVGAVGGNLGGPGDVNGPEVSSREQPQGASFEGSDAIECDEARESVMSDLAVSVNALKGSSHPGMVLLALLALRWCKSGGRFREGGDFEVDKDIPCFDWDDEESLARLDVLSDDELMRVAVGSACQEELVNAAGSLSGDPALSRYLLKGLSGEP